MTGASRGPHPLDTSRVTPSGASVDHAGGTLLAFGLRRLRRPPARGNVEDPFRAWVRTLTSLESYRGVDFALDWTAWPSTVRGAGHLDLTLFACDRRGEAADPAELHGDLADLLHAQEHLYAFETLDRDEAIDRLAAIQPHSVAEVRRRTETITTSSKPVGFAAESALHPQTEAISLWPGEVEPRSTRDKLATALLSQAAPVSVRVLLSPTALTEDEAGELEHRTDRLRRMNARLAPWATAGFSALMRARPVFEVQVLVASGRRLSPACISSVGFAISAPATTDEPSGPLTGGFDVVRESCGGGPLADGFVNLRPAAAPDHSSLGRLVRIMDVWAAAAASRPPVAGTGTFPGLDVSAPLAPGRSPSGHDGLVLGDAEVGGVVVLPYADRMRHVYMLGQTGVGKSELLLSMIADDVGAGRGTGIIDPHGDLVEAALAMIPEHRWDDVVLIEPTDPIGVVGLNLLQADTDIQREYLIAELCEWMYALYDPEKKGIVGPLFESMLRYAALLLMQDKHQWSMVEIPRLFTDHGFTEELVDRAPDVLVREFWANDARSRGSGDYAAVAAWFRSKFEPFRTVTSIRRVLGQPRSTVNLTELMDRGGILLANLSKGLLGEYNARLLGFVVFARLWAATMGRAQRPQEARREFHVYLDEAQTITTSSLPTILSEARKYGLSATLANQFFDQIPADLRASVLGNVGTKLAFRMGAPDAQAFASQFGHEMLPQELRRLPNFEVLGEMLIDGQPQDIQHIRTSPVPMPPDAAERRAALRQRARENWATPVEQIDAEFARRYSGHSSSSTTPARASGANGWWLDSGDLGADRSL